MIFIAQGIFLYFKFSFNDARLAKMEKSHEYSFYILIKFELKYFPPQGRMRDPMRDWKGDPKRNPKRGTRDPKRGSFIVKFGYSEKATKFEKIFHLKFDITQ